jgi:hypothetical protein
MATPAAVLQVLVDTRTGPAVRGLARVNTQLGATESRAQKTTAALKTMAKAGALLGAAGLAAGIKKSFDEFRQAEKVTRQTEAVLKSTAGAAKVTAKEVENLAQAISMKAGIDDEAIQSGENLLLTFTKIRNETGKGNDIFTQATRTIVDMSVALDQDLKSSAIQVGKALQDPQKGITALRRVGVNFTQTQQDMIEGWVEHGKIVKAQRFILKELGTEFGGSARAQADWTDKLKVAWDNLFEAIGRFTGPIIQRAAEWLTKFINQMQTGRGAGGEFVDRLKSIASAIEDIWNFAKKVPPEVYALMGIVVAGVKIDRKIGKLTGTGSAIGKVIGATKPVPVFVTNWGGVPGGGPAGGPATILKSPAFRAALPALATAGALGISAAAIAYLAAKVNKNLPTGAGSGPGNVAAPIERAARNRPGLVPPREAVERVKDIGEGWKKLSPIFDRSAEDFQVLINKIVRGMGRGRDATRNGMDAIRAIVRSRSEGAKDALKGRMDDMISVIHRTMRRGNQVTDQGLNLIRKLWIEELKLYGLNPRTVLNRPQEGAAQQIMNFKQRGGIIRGFQSGDIVPAMLEPGEVVINRKAVAAMGGPSTVNQINAMIPRFRTGGIVGLGRQLQREGYQVGEHPAFGGVDPVHSPRSYHYRGMAIDVNADGWPGGEMSALDRLYARLKGMPGVLELLWRVADHFDHLHVAMGPGGGRLAGLVSRLKRVTVGGRDSPLRDLVQRGLDNARRAANQKLRGVAALGGPHPSGGGGKQSNIRLGQRIAGRWGWGSGSQWAALLELWMRESGWNNMARNPSSGAFGIPQALPPGKMGPAAVAGDPRAQIRWGLKYIRQRYGSPSAALAFHNANNWYQRGGIVGARKGIAVRRGFQRPGRIPRKPHNTFLRHGRPPSRNVLGPPRNRIKDLNTIGKLTERYAMDFAAQNALAALTAGTGDDLSALRAQETAWGALLTRDSIDQLTQSTDDLAEQQRAAQVAHTEAVKEMTAQMKRNEDLILSQGPALIGSLVQVTNGGIGGPAGLGRGFPSSTGLGGMFRA